MSSTPFEHDTITTRETDGHATHDADWLAALRSEAVQNIVKMYHTTVNADSHGAPVPVVRLHTSSNQVSACPRCEEYRQSFWARKFGSEGYLFTRVGKTSLLACVVSLLTSCIYSALLRPRTS